MATTATTSKLVEKLALEFDYYTIITNSQDNNVQYDERQ